MCKGTVFHVQGFGIFHEIYQEMLEMTTNPTSTPLKSDAFLIHPTKSFL